ncbi:ankyrin repeat domain-containing protein [Nonomuraea recticatena]|uniref:Ankyrin repeat domain-containing protein n=1 Tax=Nonomuraea recticatena TaxID=46178 RepID=A0ABP6DYY9_9ACTN
MSPYGWSGMYGFSWNDLDQVRARLDGGAAPNSGLDGDVPPLHNVAEWGSPAVITELIRRGADVDAEHEGRTALWVAVFMKKLDNVRVLVSAGADPWHPGMGGWSPGRLNLAGPAPELFGSPPGEIGLSEPETAAVAEAQRLINALGDFDYDGLSIECVSGMNAADAAQRLNATPVDEAQVQELMEDPWSAEDDGESVVGITNVPGGCVITQPWGFGANSHSAQLSVGTVCYGMYANPKSGNQGSVAINGVLVESDTHPGGGNAFHGQPTEEILREYLYQGEALAYCANGAGLRLTDNRAIVGPADIWVRVPD